MISSFAAYADVQRSKNQVIFTIDPSDRTKVFCDVSGDRQHSRSEFSTEWLLADCEPLGGSDGEISIWLETAFAMGGGVEQDADEGLAVVDLVGGDEGESL